MLDAERTLARFMANGMPQWLPFREAIGGLIAELRLRHPTVCAYGEMVDVLWQRGEREAALRLEQYWNELGQLQTFRSFAPTAWIRSIALRTAARSKSVCKAHTRFIPSHDPERFDAAVGSDAQSARYAARPDPAHARRQAPPGDANAGGTGDAVLAEAEHAAHRGESP